MSEYIYVLNYSSVAPKLIVSFKKKNSIKLNVAEYPRREKTLKI